MDIKLKIPASMAAENVIHHKLILYIGLSLLFFLFTLIQLTQVSYAKQLPSAHPNTNDKVQEKTLSQALEALAEKLGMEISMTGTAPEEVMNIALNDIPVEKAIDRLMHLYGVTSHAAIYDFEEKTLLLTILQSSTSVSKTTNMTESLGRGNFPRNSNLNKTQLAQLLSNQNSNSEKMLTTDQTQKLKNKNLKSESKNIENEQKVLNAVQINELKAKYSEQNLSVTADQHVLTLKQKEMLKLKERKFNFDKNENIKLTPEQKAKLKENVTEGYIN